MPLFIQNPPVDFLDRFPISTCAEIPSLLTLEVVLFGPQRAKTPWFGTGHAWKMVRFCVGWHAKHPEPEGFRAEMFHPSGLRSRIFWRQPERNFDPVYMPPGQKPGGFGTVRATKGKFHGQWRRDLATRKMGRNSCRVAVKRTEF